MYKVIFYRDKNGDEQVKEYIDGLAAKTDKSSRIKLNKIMDYIDYLAAYGLTSNANVMKHIESDIWELRPMRDRIFFVCWLGDTFILLHQFIKKSQKTPQREIDQAKREYADIIERSNNNE